jgi:hypothetical protein
MRVVNLSTVRAQALGLSLVAVAISAAVAPRAEAQSSCNPRAPSLNPSRAFQDSELAYFSYALNSKSFTPRVIAVNSADQFQYALASAQTPTLLSGVTQFNSVFPPTGTGNLPRLFLSDPLTIGSFYDNVGAYTPDQLTAVQALYALDLTSRRNYALNVTNLARDLTSLRTVPTLSPAHLSLFDDALAALRAAYGTLSNSALPAPDPRALYRRLAADIRLLSDDEGVDIGYTRWTRSLDILSIGISNYDTNRIPVPGGANNPNPTACPGCFPLPDFDIVRNQPLSQPQLNPGSVFRSNVEALFARFGVAASALSPDVTTGLGFFDYQVSSADQLQFVHAAFTSFPTSELEIFFASGFPNVGPNNLPSFAFKTNANGYLNSATSALTTQRRLLAFYSDPANAARRGNYGKNLQNLLCAFQQLSADPGLPRAALPAVQSSIATLVSASTVLGAGGLPNVLGTYQALNQNLTTVFSLLGAGARNVFNPNFTSIGALRTLDLSLVPIGVVNYYFTPIVLTGTTAAG